jgi:hypothetical protein
MWEPGWGRGEEREGRGEQGNGCSPGLWQPLKLTETGMRTRTELTAATNLQGVLLTHV